MDEVKMPDALLNRPWDVARKLPIPRVNEFMTPDGMTVNYAAVNGMTAFQLGQRRQCSLCGEDIGWWVAFLGNEEEAAKRLYEIGPMHIECVEAAVQLCPHIQHPVMRRLAKTTPMHGADPEQSIEQPPELWVAYITRKYRTDITADSVGGVAARFKPDPPKTLRSWLYDDTGKLVEVKSR